MLIIAASLPVHPDRLDDAKAAASEMARASRAEDGCLAYGFHQDVEVPTRFHIFERWADADALKAHFATPHMAAFQSKIGELIAGEIEATRYEIASSGPVVPDT